MRRFWTVLGNLVKVVAVAAAASAVRIVSGQGEGVFEKAAQEAFAEMAERYARKVKS
jgi:hypothetical protein